MFCPLRTTGSGETVVQAAGETRFVVDCKVNPAALVGHVKIIFAPEGITVSCGWNEILNTEPLPPLPPSYAVPYRVLPDRINPADGSAPSLLVPVFVSRAVKLYRFVKPVPSVFTLNTVPLLELLPPVVNVCASSADVSKSNAVQTRAMKVALSARLNNGWCGRPARPGWRPADRNREEQLADEASPLGSMDRCRFVRRVAGRHRRVACATQQRFLKDARSRIS